MATASAVVVVALVGSYRREPGSGGAHPVLATVDRGIGLFRGEGDPACVFRLPDRSGRPLPPLTVWGFSSPTLVYWSPVDRALAVATGSRVRWIRPQLSSGWDIRQICFAAGGETAALFAGTPSYGPGVLVDLGTAVTRPAPPEVPLRRGASVDTPRGWSLHWQRTASGQDDWSLVRSGVAAGTRASAAEWLTASADTGVLVLLGPARTRRFRGAWWRTVTGFAADTQTCELLTVQDQTPLLDSIVMRLTPVGDRSQVVLRSRLHIGFPIVDAEATLIDLLSAVALPQTVAEK